MTGSTVFSATELAGATAPYTNRAVTTADLEELRLALTRLYVEKGYINSGAVIPDQTVTNGVISFQIIEGSLSRVELDLNHIEPGRLLGGVVKFKALGQGEGDVGREAFVESTHSMGVEADARSVAL